MNVQREMQRSNASALNLLEVHVYINLKLVNNVHNFMIVLMQHLMHYDDEESTQPTLSQKTTTTTATSKY